MGLTNEGNKKTPVQVVPQIIAVNIASGTDHLVILTKSGNVFTIGCAEQGQLGRVTSRTLTGESRRGKKSLLTPGLVPKKTKNFVANAIWATPFCTFLRESKTDLIYGFGLNNYNQLGVKKSDKEFEHYPILSKFADVKAIAGGQHHTIVLTNDNKVHAIGRKDYGRLGLGDIANDVDTLTTINSLKDIAYVTCGESSSFAVTSDGKPYVWGMGTSSQLGTGDEDDVTEPKLLASAQIKDKKVLSIGGGGQHSLFIVEAPKSIVAKPAAAPVTEVIAPVETKNDSEAAPKEDNTSATKPAGKGGKKKVAEAPVIMESDSTTDVNGNSEKDEKLEIDTGAVKRARKRKA